MTHPSGIDVSAHFRRGHRGLKSGYSHTRTATLGQSALPTATQIDSTDGQARLSLVFGTGKKRTIDSQKIDHILRPVFKTKIGQGAFDTLALAEPSGKLVLAVGRREWEMSSMTLSALLPDRKVADGLPASEPGTPRNAAVAGGSPTPATSGAPAISFERITVLDAVVAGVPVQDVHPAVLRARDATVAGSCRSCGGRACSFHRAPRRGHGHLAHVGRHHDPADCAGRARLAIPERRPAGPSEEDHAVGCVPAGILRHRGPRDSDHSGHHLTAMRAAGTRFGPAAGRSGRRTRRWAE